MEVPELEALTDDKLFLVQIVFHFSSFNGFFDVLAMRATESFSPIRCPSIDHELIRQIAI